MSTCLRDGSESNSIVYWREGWTPTPEPILKNTLCMTGSIRPKDSLVYKQEIHHP
jgi:hypothetical protein